MTAAEAWNRLVTGAFMVLVLFVLARLAWPETVYEPRWVAIEMARVVEEGR